MAHCIHVFVIICLVIAESAVLTGKALFCRDPDTGKLHAVNTTWVSTTFCGNYTCKLRKRNLTETEYTPIRTLNITNIKESNETRNPNTDLEEFTETSTSTIDLNNTYTASENDTNENIENVTITIEDRTELEIQPVIHKEKSTEATMREISTKQDDDNRYLTENEIKSIAEVLHTVKKSDLDAIVDIYNLAQDIYDEMDKATNEVTIDETINAIHSDAGKKYRKHPKKSYWYDPLIYKGRMDMENQGSNLVSTVQPVRELPSYFNGALKSQDFSKMPYYYPLTSFQRSSSYVHQPTKPAVERPKPCKARERSYNDIQGSQNLIQPSYLLPYPFAYIHHNYSDYKNTYYNNNAYNWDYYNRQKPYPPYYNSFMPQMSQALTKPQFQEDLAKEFEIEQTHLALQEKGMLGKILLKAKENVMPDWKTEQLSRQILEEVRANIDPTKLIKAYPFKKKVKLEKVGKMIKLDELTRERRSADEVDVSVHSINQVEEGEMFVDEEGKYETYLEKTTCKTVAVPGYFRYGNLSHPYPECCPQLINNQ